MHNAGLKRNEDGTWMVFNREYLPLGFGDIDYPRELHNKSPYNSIPVNNPYPMLDAKFIKKLIDLEDTHIEYDSNKMAKLIFLYNDGTNPINNPKGWKSYFQKIKLLSQLKVVAFGKAYPQTKVL